MTELVVREPAHSESDDGVVREASLVSDEESSEGLAHAPLDDILQSDLDQRAALEQAVHLLQSSDLTIAPGQGRRYPGVHDLVDGCIPRHANQCGGGSMR